MMTFRERAVTSYRATSGNYWSKGPIPHDPHPSQEPPNDRIWEQPQYGDEIV